MKIYNRFNFHKHTYCEFRLVSADETSKLTEGYKSKSGSTYFFTENGVYRYSNHWGRAANCRWRLLTTDKYKNQQWVWGYAQWHEFYPNNEYEELFFITIDFETNTVGFQHKNHPSYSGQFLRNASETAKRIQDIKGILTNDAWAKYCKTENINETRLYFVNQLCITSKKLIDIKNEYFHGTKE